MQGSPMSMKGVVQRQAAFAVASAAVCVISVILWLQQKRKRQLDYAPSLESSLTAWSSAAQPDKVLDLRAEEAFNAVRLKGSHNISHTSLFAENRWFELPDKLEALALVSRDKPLQIRSPDYAFQSRSLDAASQWQFLHQCL
jgi:hypothetical protein